MTDLKEVLRLHKLYLEGNSKGERANLKGAYIERSNLKYANLAGANLIGANLKGANLYRANLYSANLEGASLIGANLCYANLEGANLYSANLCYANLEEANLYSANLRCSNLKDAKLPDFQIVPSEGAFIGWKKTTKGVIKLRIPKEAKRTASLVSRTCRAEFVKVVSGNGCGGQSPSRGNLTYDRGAIVKADSYNDDIRIDCTNGIHFFMTKEEAESW